MVGVNVWWVYLAPQTIPSVVALTFDHKVVLSCVQSQEDGPDSEAAREESRALRRIEHVLNGPKWVNHTVLWSLTAF